jgi:glycosyltransferase involved in cell wall biosynthesis
MRHPVHRRGAVSRTDIRKVLLSGAGQIGGLDACVQALAEGFKALGVPSEIVPPQDMWRRQRELRDPTVLKILSTATVFAVPLARRVICVAHGFPRPDAQGWGRTIAILASLALANHSRGCRLVAVSDYVAAHLRGVYGLRVDAVIRNAVQPMFLEPWEESKERNEERPCLTYAGRLIPAKNLHRLLPAMRRLLDEDPRLRVCIVGDGPQRQQLESSIGGDARVEFWGSLASREVRARLRETRVFVSGNEMEPFGITYIEALSQGCAVAMPACGGGLEIANELIGSQVQLLPLSFEVEAVLEALRRASRARRGAVSMTGFQPTDAASSYLELGRAAG